MKNCSLGIFQTKYKSATRVGQGLRLGLGLGLRVRVRLGLDIVIC